MLDSPAKQLHRFVHISHALSKQGQLVEQRGRQLNPGRPLELVILLVDYPVRMAVEQSVILPPERPLPPRRWWSPPAPPE